MLCQLTYLSDHISSLTHCSLAAMYTNYKNSKRTNILKKLSSIHRKNMHIADVT